jgi:hypothetical protein
MKSWTPRDDKDLLRMLGSGFSHGQIAKHFGCTSNRVRQRQRKLSASKPKENAQPYQKKKETRQWALKEERLHMAKVALMPCAVKGEDCYGRVEVHHIRKGNEARNHRRVIPLCSYHHRDNKNGYHGMSREAFDERYKINAREFAEKLWSTK